MRRIAKLGAATVVWFTVLPFIDMMALNWNAIWETAIAAALAGLMIKGVTMMLTPRGANS